MYTSLASNEILIAFVTNNHFESGGYSNTTGDDSWFRVKAQNTTTRKPYGALGYQTNSPHIKLFGGMLEGYDTGVQGYEDLTPSQCINLYSTDFLLDRRNLFLITNYTADPIYNNTFLRVDWNGGLRPPSNWMCFRYPHTSFRCDPTWLNSRVASGHPWLVEFREFRERGVGEVLGCKSERVAERCKVHFSLGIMVAVICCNLVKACCMVMTVVRSREPTLVTLGDAIDSFLRIPDQTTIGICFADRHFIETEWMRGSRGRPRKWKQKGVQRWWSSVSRRRWIICSFFCSIAIIITGVLFEKGIGQDRKLMSTDIQSL